MQCASMGRWPGRAALVAGALAAFAALMVAAGLYRAGKEGESASVESGAGPMLNQGALPAYTELATSGFSVVVNSCDSSGAAGTVTNRGSNRAAVTVAARFYDQAGVRLGGWNDKVDGVDPATTADWYVAGGYVGVDRCEALVTSAFVTP